MEMIENIAVLGRADLGRNVGVAYALPNCLEC